VQDTREGEGRFIFCGLRDIASELESEIKAEETANIAGGIKEDRVTHTLLKSIALLANEFSHTVELVKRPLNGPRSPHSSPGRDA
jgi:hypothetical protein